MYYYILNPAAGNGAINRLQDKIKTKLKELGISGEFAKTTGPGDATTMATAAITKGYNTIVVVGGDGTVNEIINGISREQVAIGIIPIGHTNNLAGQLGITDWEQACEVLAARRLNSFGLIAAGQNFFLSTLTLGFETDLDKTVEQDAEGWQAKLRGLWQSFTHAQHYQPLGCHIEVDNRFELSSPVFSLSVTNQKFLNPAAENKLIISITAKPKQNLGLTGYLWRLLRRPETLEEVAATRFPAERIMVRTTPATGIMADGKLISRTPIAIRLSDRRIRFITEKTQQNFRAKSK